MRHKQYYLKLGTLVETFRCKTRLSVIILKNVSEYQDFEWAMDAMNRGGIDLDFFNDYRRERRCYTQDS